MSAGADCIITAIIGAAGGVGATYVVMRKKIDEKQKEVEEVRGIYAEKARENGDLEKEQRIRNVGMPKEEKEQKAADMKEYREKVKASGYTTDYSGDNPGQRVKKRKKDWIEPRIITPDAFGELEEDGTGWSTRTLFYFSDGVLTDDNNDKIEDIETLIGDDALNHFGEYEEDSVYVRNENRKIDYEILLDQRKWSEVNAKRPKVKYMED